MAEGTVATFSSARVCRTTRARRTHHPMLFVPPWLVAFCARRRARLPSRPVRRRSRSTARARAYTSGAWPPNGYDQGLPVVEVRQGQLLAVLDEVEQQRRDRERN